MDLLIVNPNSTASMTAGIGAAAGKVAGPQTSVRAVNPTDTPPAIQGPEDGEACLPGLFRTFDLEVAAQRPDAAIVACFDDTGLGELKHRAGLRVYGIGEAAYHAAMLAAERFSVVTTLAVSIPVIEDNIARYGFTGRCARVRASGVAVLELEDPASNAAARVAAEVERAIADDGCGSIVLGCAGMADLAADMTQRYRLPVIDGVTAAVVLAEALDRLGPRA